MSTPEVPSDKIARLEEHGQRAEMSVHHAERYGTQGSWPPGVTYAHLARWDDVTARRIQALAEGGRDVEAELAFADYRHANRLWAETDAGIDTDHAREWWHTTRNKLLLTLRSLNNEDWTGLIPQIVDEVFDHYQAHIDRPWEFETD